MTLRDEIVANALWGADNEPTIHYSQGPQRMAALDTPRALPLYTDCSGFLTYCYAWAGAPDPNGRGYDGTGFTGTLLEHLPVIPLADAQPGDPIVYGPGSGQHVVIVVKPGTDPLVVSHGQEKGPFRVRHSVEAAAHSAPFRSLRGVEDNAQPVPPPPAPPIPKEQQMGVLIRNPKTGEIRMCTAFGTWHVQDPVTELPLVEFALLHSAQVNDATDEQWAAWMLLPNFDKLIGK